MAAAGMAPRRGLPLRKGHADPDVACNSYGSLKESEEVDLTCNIKLYMYLRNLEKNRMLNNMCIIVYLLNYYD